MGVRISQIRLDVIDGRPVHQVSAPYIEYPFLKIHPFQPDGREAQRIGAEWRARCEDAETPVAAQARRTDRRLPSPLRGRRIGGKAPDQPDVFEFFQPPQGVGIAINARQMHFARQLRNQRTLARDAELLRERGMENGDGLHRARLTRGCRPVRAPSRHRPAGPNPAPGGSPDGSGLPMGTPSSGD